jgi:MoxR-like ATPase
MTQVNAEPSLGRLPAPQMVTAARAAVVGRRREIEVIAATLAAGRSVLLEGPPGTGKTTLLRALAEGAGLPLLVVEGNAELTPGRLVGHHDPSRVLGEGYHPDTWVPGPLAEAMTTGGLLYVEELNRVPEETLNVLLGALSERRLQVPRFGTVVAAPTFRVVAAMNPFDTVGTGRVTPALYDRTCRVAVGYQSEDEERAIVDRAAEAAEDRQPPRPLVERAVRVVRATRQHPDLRTGASVRGAIDLVLVAEALGALRDGAEPPAARAEVGLDAALTALSGRVGVREGCARSPEDVVTEIWRGSADQDDPGKGRGPAVPPARTPPPPASP